MARGRKTRGKRRSPWLLVALAAGAISIAALALLMLPDANDATGDAARGNIERLPDVHGLAVDPERPDRLLVATHEGLVRYEDGVWSRASERPLDLMGFALHPTDGDVAWASGHPPEGGALGIVKSMDGGATWAPVALAGKDIHALAVSPADPQRVWGFLAGALHRSDDGGATWRIVAPDAPSIFALRGSPEGRDVVLATTGDGIARSVDGGATWGLLAPLRAYAVAFTADGALVGAGEDVQRSTDGGVTWTKLASPPGPIAYLAAHPTDPMTMYAASFRAGVYQSTDGGASWNEIMAPSR